MASSPKPGKDACSVKLFLGGIAHGEHKFSALHDVVVGEERLGERFAIEFHALDILVFAAVVDGFYHKLLAVGEVDGYLVVQGATNRVNRLARTYLIESHSIEDIPSRHLSAVFVARKAIVVVEVKGIQHLVDEFLSLPRLSGVVIEVYNVVAWFVAVCILSYKTRYVGRN